MVDIVWDFMKSFLKIGIIMFALVVAGFFSQQAMSDPLAQNVYHFEMDSTGIRGITGVLSFDLINGGIPGDNTVTISNIKSDGKFIDASKLTGGVKGSFLGEVSFIDSDPVLNSISQKMIFGTSLSFDVIASNNDVIAPNNFEGHFPDNFYLAILNSTEKEYLVDSENPDFGDDTIDTLFEITLTGSLDNTMRLYRSKTPGVTWSLQAVKLRTPSFIGKK
jgi:hypothetical protein